MVAATTKLSISLGTSNYGQFVWIYERSVEDLGVEVMQKRMK